MVVNMTFSVSSTIKCHDIREGLEHYKPDPVWRTTALGCKILELLQGLYQFEMTYVEEFSIWDTFETSALPESRHDVLARPVPLGSSTIRLGYPVEAVIDRSYGFILRPCDSFGVRPYFGLPFTPKAWHCLYVIVLLITVILYFLSRWEKWVLGVTHQEYSFSSELLLVFGAISQHVPPVAPLLPSRRVAYFTVFCFCYILYTYYTSNLLSHLVNDRDKTMTLEQLIDSDFSFITLNNNTPRHVLMVTTMAAKINFTRHDLFRKKISEMKSMNVSAALNAVATSKVALFSDYITVYPYMKEELSDQTICELIEVHYLTQIKEYLFVSNQFPMKEEFKIGILRFKETGVLKRMKREHIYSKPTCHFVPETQARLSVVGLPVIILASSFALSALLLLVEHAYYERTRVWPYVN